MKKLLSFVLILVLTLTLLSETVFATDEAGYLATDERCITVAEAIEAYEKENNTKVETFRQYFLLPDSNTVLKDTSYSELSDTVVKPWIINDETIPCIWYQGDNCPVTVYVGYKMLPTDDANVWYADIPVSTTKYVGFIINNGIGNVDPNQSESLPNAYMSTFLGKGIAPEYDKYDDCNNKIYVFNKYYAHYSADLKEFSGELFYYYGGSCYGDKENGEKETADCLNPQHPHSCKYASQNKVIKKKTNPIKVKVKSVNVKAKDLNKNKSIKSFVSISKAQGKTAVSISKITLKGKKVSAKIFKKFKLNKNGTLTMKKGVKKGVYKICLKINAKGNSKFKSKTLNKNVNVKVK